MIHDLPRGSPIHPLAGPILSEFLAGPGGGIIARLDADGAIRAASRRLSDRVTPGRPVLLADLLNARSSARWEALRAAIGPGSPARRVVLAFRGVGAPKRVVGLVHRDESGDLWLLALPVPAAEMTGQAERSSRNQAVSHRHPARSHRLLRQLILARIEANTDPLTGLANRRQGDRWLRRAVARRHAGSAPLCCIVADLDDFKSINDDFGHAVGDRILRRAARVFRGHLRPADRIYRLGGEEFVMLLPGTDLDDGRALADRLRESLTDRPIRHRNRSVLASFGIACHRPGESAFSFLQRADLALLRAKKAGRDRIEWDS